MTYIFFFLLSYMRSEGQIFFVELDCCCFHHILQDYKWFKYISLKVLLMLHHRTTLGFPGSSDGKESACSAGDLGSIPGWGRCPGGGHGNPLQYSCLENPHGQRSLAGYSPWGCNESDMTKMTWHYKIDN